MVYVIPPKANFINMGAPGFDRYVEVDSIDASRVKWKSLNTYWTINVEELSTMTFEDAMAFVGSDYAVAA